MYIRVTFACFGWEVACLELLGCVCVDGVWDWVDFADCNGCLTRLELLCLGYIQYMYMYMHMHVACMGS